MSFPEVGSHYEIVVERRRALDTMLIRLEMSDRAFSDRINDLMEIKRRVTHRLKSVLNIAVEVELVDPGSLPRFQGKARRVIDRREI